MKTLPLEIHSTIMLIKSGVYEVNLVTKVCYTLSFHCQEGHVHNIMLYLTFYKKDLAVLPVKYVHYYAPCQRSWGGGILVSLCPCVHLSICRLTCVHSISSTIQSKSPWSNNICCLSCIANTMLISRASIGTVLPQSRHIPSPLSEELITCHL